MKILNGVVGPFACACLMFFASVCPAQVRNSLEPVSDRSVFVPAPRELLRPLTRAARAIEEGHSDQAVALLGQILSNPSPQDYLVPAADIPGAEGVNISLCVRASQMLGGLSTQDRESYRLRYGTQAKLMLGQAVENNDFKTMSRLMQRYFFTEAGYLATMLLGHHYLDQGRPAAAANCFQRIVDFEESRRLYEPEASVLLATSRALSNSPERARQALIDLKRRQPTGRIKFNGDEVELFVDDVDAFSWLQNLIGDSPLRNIYQVDQWMMLGGNPERNARSGSGFPLLHPRWEVPTENDPDIETQILDRQRELLFLDAAPIPAVQPLAIGNTILMRGFDRLVGVDFTTGKRTWVFPPWDLKTGSDTELTGPRETVSLPSEQLTERFWQDSIYGQSSSDGTLVFVVPRPGFASLESSRIDEELLTIADPIVKREFNELKAIQVDRQGAFKWEIGGSTGLDEPQLARAFFLGAALPLDGSLYALCQQDGYIKLVALDSQTGKLQWSQLLVSVEASANVIDDRFRRLAGATPSYSDGVLVCATGAGALVAVDLATRSLRWGFQFHNPTGKDVSRISPSQRFAEMVLGGLWRESTITISDGFVLHTPVDTQHLICVDLQTGFPKWKHDNKFVSQLPRGDSLYVACIELGNAILVGRSSIRAIRLRDGFPLWERNTEDFGRPSGRGYANHGKYYLPMSSACVLQIDLLDGAITNSAKTDGVLGNLVCHQGDVISHGAARLACFPQDQPQRELIHAAEAKGELSAELLAIKSQLQFQDAKLSDSIGSLAAAYEKTGSTQYANRLRDLIVELIQTDYRSGIGVAQQYRSELQLDRHFTFAAAQIDGLIGENELMAASEQLLSLLKTRNTFGFKDNDFIDFSSEQFDGIVLTSATEKEKPQVVRNSTINIRTDRWIASRLQIVADRIREPGRAGFLARVQQFFSDLESSDPVAMYELAELLPAEMLAPQQCTELATRLFLDDEYLRASTILQPPAKSENDAVAFRALAELAQMYVTCNSTGQALKVLSKIRQLKGATNIGGPEVPLDFATRFTEKYRLDKDQSAQVRNPRYTHAKADYSETDRQLEFQMIPNEIALSECDDLTIEQYRFHFFSQTGEIAVTDQNGKLLRRFLARKNLNSEIPPINNYVTGDLKVNENLGLLTIGFELFAIDWLKFNSGDDPVLWNLVIQKGEKDQSSTLPAKIWGETRMSSRRLNYENKIIAAAPSSKGVCYLDGTNLFCVDAVDGTRRWRRTNVPARSMLYGDQEKVVVWNPNKRDVVIIDILSGRQLKQFTLRPELGALWTNLGTQFLLTSIAKSQPSNLKKPVASQSILPRDDLRRENQAENHSDPSVEPAIVQTLGVFDLMEERFVWKRQFPEKSVGCLIRDEKLVVLPSAAGEVEFIRLDSGRTEMTTRLVLGPTERASIDGIGISIAKGTYVLHFRRGATSARVDLLSRNIRIRNLHYYDTFWTGYLLATDSATGQPKWEKPVRFDNFQVGKRTPYNLPFHVLVRRYERKTGRKSISLQFVILDLESGRSLANISVPYEFRNQYWPTWDPPRNQLQFNFATDQLSVNFQTASDYPPRPLASLSNASSIPFLKPALNTNLVDADQESRELETIRWEVLQAEKNFKQVQAEEARLLEREK